MKYIIPIQEQISVWQNIDIQIDTDDSIKEVYKHIKQGDLVPYYGIDEYCGTSIIYDTEKNLEYDYSNTSLYDIEVVEN